MDNMFSTPKKSLNFPEQEVEEVLGNTNSVEVIEEDDNYSSVAGSDTEIKEKNNDFHHHSFSDDYSEKSKHRSVVDIFQFANFQPGFFYSYNNTSHFSMKSDNCDDSLSDQFSGNEDDGSKNAGSHDGNRNGEESMDEGGSGDETADENKAEEVESDGEMVNRKPG